MDIPLTSWTSEYHKNSLIFYSNYDKTIKILLIEGCILSIETDNKIKRDEEKRLNT
jgi:hypothetical protein